MALKQDGVHFVFCPEQGMYFRIFFVLNRVSNPQRLTYSPTLVEYCPPLPLPSLPGIAVQQMLRRMCALILFDTCNTLWGIFERPLTNCSCQAPVHVYRGERLWVLWWRWCELRKYKSYLKIWSSQCLWVLLCKVSPQQNQFLNQWETTNRIL